MPDVSKVAGSTNLFNGTLTIRPGGAARVEALVDPQEPKLSVEPAPALENPKAVQLKGDAFVVASSTKRDQTQERRPTAHNFQFGNVGGEDRVYLTADAPGLNGRANYDIVITDAANQDAITAELTPTFIVSNGSDEDFRGALRVALNETPRYGARGGGYQREAMMAVADAAEGSSGAVILPLSSEVEIGKRSETTLNISGAVDGTPNEQKPNLPVTLKQTLRANVPFHVVADEGAKFANVICPQSSFEMSGTAAPRPEGTYTIYEETGAGVAEAGSTVTGQYRERNKKETIPGVVVAAIEVASEFETTDVQAQGQNQAKVQVEGSLTVSSSSEHDRKVTIALPSPFEGGVQVEVKKGNQVVPASVNPETGSIEIKNVAATSAADTKLDVKLTGNVRVYR